MRRTRTARVGVTALVAAMSWGVMTAQTPRPFPAPAPPQPSSAQPTPPATPAAIAPAEQPNEALLGAPVFPKSQFVASYDAGRGQRYYIFAADALFADVVAFYRTALKQRGDVLFETPPTHQFETGRFRDETMAFPPSVTIKDYTFGGSAGYPNPTPGAQPARFPTVIQIVPAPPATAPG